MMVVVMLFNVYLVEGVTELIVHSDSLLSFCVRNSIVRKQMDSPLIMLIMKARGQFRIYLDQNTKNK